MESMKQGFQSMQPLYRVTIVWAVLILIGLSAALKATDTNQSDHLLKKTKWREITKDVHYIPEKADDQDANRAPSFSDGLTFSPAVKLVLVLTVILIIGYLTYRLLRHQTGLKTTNEQASSGFSIEEVDKAEDTEIRNLPERLQRALQEENYTEAVRLYYLMIIRSFRDAGFIQWQKDKTNHDYLREISGRAEFEQFKQATRTFERVWYGTLSLDHDQFRRYEAQFVSLARQLNIDLNAQ